jgi:hypothetical protein
MIRPRWPKSTLVKCNVGKMLDLQTVTLENSSLVKNVTSKISVGELYGQRKKSPTYI